MRFDLLSVEALKPRLLGLERAGLLLPKPLCIERNYLPYWQKIHIKFSLLTFLLRFLFWPHELGSISSPPATFWPMSWSLEHLKVCQSYHLVGLLKGLHPGTVNPIEFPQSSPPITVVTWTHSSTLPSLSVI